MKEEGVHSIAFGGRSRNALMQAIFGGGKCVKGLMEGATLFTVVQIQEALKISDSQTKSSWSLMQELFHVKLAVGYYLEILLS